MIKFDGLVIKVEPDYKDRIEKGIEIDELWCEVYQESDTEFKHKLGDFNMTQGFEYDEESVESIEKGIKKMVESDWASYQLEIKTLELDRTKQILGNAVEYIKESPSMAEPSMFRICFARLLSSLFVSNHTPLPLLLAMFLEIVLSLTIILILLWKSLSALLL